MKKHAFVLTVWSFLLVLRLADVAAAVIQLREVQDRERTLLYGQFQLNAPEADVRQRLSEEKREHWNQAIGSGVELVIVLILGICCLRLIKSQLAPV